MIGLLKMVVEMIVVNLNKSKLIAHGIRRNKRLEEFFPFDEIIAKQILNQMEFAESQRKLIREKYAVMQLEIDSSNSLDEIKQALNKT